MDYQLEDHERRIQLLEEADAATRKRVEKLENVMGTLLDVSRRMAELQEKGQKWVFDIERAVGRVTAVEIQMKQEMSKNTKKLDIVLKALKEK